MEKYIHYWLSFFRKKDKTNDLKALDLQMFCQAFLYHPTLEFGMKDESNEYKYIFHKPVSLSPYLRMFLPPDMETEEDDNEVRDVLHRKGIKDINAEHNFLKAEGSFTCSCCNACFCNKCGYSPKKDRDEKKVQNVH